MEKLEKEFPNYVKGSNEDNWPVILLGLAISYIQKRYSLVDPDFASLKFEKKTLQDICSNRARLRQRILLLVIWLALHLRYMGILSVTMVCLSYRWPY